MPFNLADYAINNNAINQIIFLNNWQWFRIYDLDKANYAINWILLYLLENKNTLKLF